MEQNTNICQILKLINPFRAYLRNRNMEEFIAEFQTLWEGLSLNQWIKIKGYKLENNITIITQFILMINEQIEQFKLVNCDLLTEVIEKGPCYLPVIVGKIIHLFGVNQIKKFGSMCILTFAMIDLSHTQIICKVYGQAAKELHCNFFRQNFTYRFAKVLIVKENHELGIQYFMSIQSYTQITLLPDLFNIPFYLIKPIKEINLNKIVDITGRVFLIIYNTYSNIKHLLIYENRLEVWVQVDLFNYDFKEITEGNVIIGKNMTVVEQMIQSGSYMRVRSHFYSYLVMNPYQSFIKQPDGQITSLLEFELHLQLTKNTNTFLYQEVSCFLTYVYMKQKIYYQSCKKCRNKLIFKENLNMYECIHCKKIQQTPYKNLVLQCIFSDAFRSQTLVIYDMMVEQLIGCTAKQLLSLDIQIVHSSLLSLKYKNYQLKLTSKKDKVTVRKIQACNECKQARKNLRQIEKYLKYQQYFQVKYQQ